MSSKSTHQRAATQGNGKPGNSDGAKQRRQKNAIGIVHSGIPGQTITIGKTNYKVAGDGSFRRLVDHV